MTARINPAKAAVTRVVEPAVPATVTVEMSLHQALILAAFQGRMNGGQASISLRNLLSSHPLYPQYHALALQVVAEPIYGKTTMDLYRHEGEFASLRDQLEEMQ